MQPHDIPTTPIPPTWTSNGLYSLSTRPDIAVHRSGYAITPRLFPVQTNAQQLLAPVVDFDKAAYLSGRPSNLSHPRRTNFNLEEAQNKRPKLSAPGHKNTHHPQDPPCHQPHPKLTPLRPSSQDETHPSLHPLDRSMPFPSLTPLPALSATARPKLQSTAPPAPIPRDAHPPLPVLPPVPQSSPLPLLTALPTLTPLPALTPLPVLTPLPTLHSLPASAPMPVLTPLARPSASLGASKDPNSSGHRCGTHSPPSFSLSNAPRNFVRPHEHLASRKTRPSRRFADSSSRLVRLTRIAPREPLLQEDESSEYNSGDNAPVVKNPRGFEMGSGNPLTVVRLGEEHFVVCAISGRLNSARVYNYSVTEDSYRTRQHVFRRGRQSSLRGTKWRNGNITDIVASDWDLGSSEPCRAVFVTKRRLNFAHLCTDDSRPTVDWDETVLFPNAISVALNPLYPTEFAALSADSIFVGTPTEISLKRKNRELLSYTQPKNEDTLFNRISYGQHPRSLLLTDRTKIVSFDIRARVGKGSMHVVFDTGRHLNLPWYDRGISAFHLLNERGYVAFLATQSCLNYIDLRMPSQPLLDWSLSLPKPVDQSCVSSVRTGDTCSEVISLWSRRQCFLEVYHALHQQRLPAEKFELSNLEGYGTQRKSHMQGQLPPVGRRPILWSDLPLSHLQQLKGRSRLSGMALLPSNEGRRISLLQWSPTDGLIGQLLDIRAGDETKEEFEAPPRDGYNAENAQRMVEFQRRLADCGEYQGIDKIENPLKNGLPGSQIMRFVKHQSSSDIAFTRQFLIRDDDDDVTKNGKGRFPRPYLRNMRKVQEMREASGDIYLDDEKGVVGTYVKCGNLQGESACGSGAICKNGVDWERSKGVSSASTSAALGLCGRKTGEWRMVGGTQSTDRTQASVGGGGAARNCGMPFLGSPDGSEKSSSSDGEGKEGESEMDELLDEIGFGRTLDQIAEFVRKGMLHNSTPFGVDGLRETIESSGSVKWRDVKWHEDCVEDHMEDRKVISTKKGVPDWVHTRVYYTAKVPSPERVCEELRVEKESELGQLVEELRDVILNEVEEQGQGLGGGRVRLGT